MIISLSPTNAPPAALTPLGQWALGCIDKHVAKQRRAFPNYDETHYSPEQVIGEYNKAMSHYVENWRAVDQHLLNINTEWERKMGHHSPVLPQTIQTIQLYEQAHSKLLQRDVKFCCKHDFPSFDKDDSEEVSDEKAAQFLKAAVDITMDLGMEVLPDWFDLERSLANEFPQVLEVELMANQKAYADKSTSRVTEWLESMDRQELREF